MQESTRTAANTHSQEWQERALKVFPSGVTHDNRYCHSWECVLLGVVVLSCMGLGSGLSRALCG